MRLTARKTAGMVTWAVLYLSIGEPKPWIWLMPLVAALGAVLAVAAAVRRPSPQVLRPAAVR